MRPIRIKILPAAASASNIAASQSPGTSALTLTALAAGPIDPQTGTNLLLGRILVITSGSDDAGIHFTVVGKDQNGNAVTENVTGGDAGAAVTVNYYTSVTSITPSGAGAAGTVEVGTVNTTASAAFGTIPVDFYARTAPLVAVDVSGTISYTVEMTFDDCLGANSSTNVFYVTPATPTALTTQSASKYDVLVPGVCGLAVTIPTYTSTGYIVVNVLQPSNESSG
jgi:hypothetical protein